MSSIGNLAAGTLVADRFRVDEPLADGAGVYRATDVRLDLGVTLRLLPLPPGKDAAARLDEQLLLASGVVHPNVATPLEVGVDEALHAQFAVTEASVGGTLAALLAQRGAPPAPLALRILQDVAAGAAAVHDSELVHGDLHPGMVLLERAEGGRLRARLLGVGLLSAGAASERAAARYASPERLRRSAELTPATDVFSLGVITWEVLAGLPADWNAILLGMVKGQPVTVPSPLAAKPDLARHAADAIQRAVLADPAARLRDAGQFEAALAAGLPAAPKPVDASRAVETPVAVVTADAKPADEPAASSDTATASTQAVESVQEAASAPIASAETAPSVEAEPAAAPAAPTSRRARAGASETDLRDLLYIPPEAEPAKGAAEKKPASSKSASRSAAKAKQPDPLPLLGTEVPAGTAADATAEPAPAPPSPEPIAASAAAPTAPTVREPAFAPAGRAESEPAPAAEHAAEPEPFVPVIVLRDEAATEVPEPVAVTVFAGSAPVEVLDEDAAELEPGTAPEFRERRRNFGALPPSATRTRARVMLIGGGVAGAVVLAAVAFALTRGGADAAATGGLATQALAASGTAPSAAAPAPAQTPAPVASQQPAPPPAAADPAAATAEKDAEKDDAARREEERRKEELRREEERKRLEAQRLEQARRDSVRLAEAARARQAAAPPPPAPAPAAQMAARDVAAQPTAPVNAPPAPRVDPSHVYGSGEVDQAPSLANRSELLRAVERNYPPVLKARRVGGRAVVQFVVQENGQVDPASIVVVDASDPAFRAAARATITRARFNPARLDGRPVKVQASLPIDWTS